MSVLDAVEHIRLHEDPSLMYRHSCHHSSCGTCACKINGKARLMCTTRVAELESEPIILEPLDGLPKRGDLVVDMTGFYGHISEHWGYLHDLGRDEAQNMPEGIDTFQRFEACIECGSCVSACPVTQKNTEFMGPAALAAINVELQKSAETTEELIDAATGEHGERWCERAIECSRVCPTGVAPAKHIQQLRTTLHVRKKR